MDIMFNLLSTAVGVIGGADGPTDVLVSSDGLPIPALTVAAFAVIFILYVYISKAINAKKVTAEACAPSTEKIAPAPAVYTGPELIGVTEKEAAVIMALISDKTGIPLNRLKFESIKLSEDK